MGHGIDALFKYVVTWNLLGQLCQNVWFFRAKETTPSDDLFEDVDFIIGDVKDWMLTPMLNFMSTDVALVQTDVTCVDPLGGPNNTHLWDGVIGSVNSPSLPSYVSGVISMHTGYSGRRTHGRTYVPGVPQSFQDGNNLTSLGLTGLVNCAQSWFSRYRDGGTSTRYYGTVFSKANGVVRVPGPPPALHYSALAGVPWKTVDARQQLYTQRHRLAGRGI